MGTQIQSTVERDVLITGIHRSGTTFTGEVLRAAGLFQIVEPCNLRYGSVLVDRWKPYPDSRTREGLPYRSVVERILTERIRFKPDLQSGNPLVRLAGRVLGLHRQALRYNLDYQLNRFAKKRRVFKDPDLVFFANELQIRNLFDVVILVRHPCGFHDSVKRLGWRMSLDNFTSQDSLVRRHLQIYPEHLARKERSFAEDSAICWLFVYTVLKDFLDSNPHLILVRHEDLAMRPEVAFPALFSRLGIPFGPDTARFVEQHTQGGRIEARENRPHDLVRDSRGLATRWTSSLTGEEIDSIRRIVSPVFDFYYPEWIPSPG